MIIRSQEDICELEKRKFEDVYPHRSPYEIISASAEKFPENIAIHFLQNTAEPEFDVKITYRELLSNIDAAAEVFREMGVVFGKTVALISAHTPSAHAALWGAQKAGSVFPINPMLRPDHIAALLQAADVSVIVMMGVNSQQNYWSDLAAGLRKAGVDLPILDCDSDAPSAGSDGCFESLMAEKLRDPTPFEPHGNEHSLASCFHTGGTTAAPKIVEHSRLNEAYVARSCEIMHGHNSKDVALNGFPLFHVAGAFVYGLSILSAGGKLLVPGRLGMRDPAFVADVWGQLARHNTTVICAVPTVLSLLLNGEIKPDISTLRVALTGGSPLSPELAELFERKTCVPVRNIFGMTESAGTIAVEPFHSPRTPKSCGYRLPFSQIAIVPNNGEKFDAKNILPSGETGIIAVRGPNVSSGYRDSKHNAEVFENDGWLLSGDLGEIDEQGKLFITGREKDVIIRGSHNIDPQGIEDALMSHDSVTAAAAIGMPDAYAGELPVAFVTLNKKGKVTGEELIAYLAEHIDEPAAMPRRIEIIDQMPMTPIGKIFKPALRKIAMVWAVELAADGAGIGREDYTIAIQDNLKIEVVTAMEIVDGLREALTGMPIDFVVVGK